MSPKREEALKLQECTTSQLNKYTNYNTNDDVIARASDYTGLSHFIRSTFT